LVAIPPSGYLISGLDKPGNTQDDKKGQAGKPA
jgi:hypothetical protein